MKIIEMNTRDVIPYENNPRNNEKAVGVVAKSIQRYGFIVPLILDKEHVIIAGHTRLEAAIFLGLEKVPVVIAENLTDEQARAYRLVDNKTQEASSWNFEKLEAELELIEDRDEWIEELFKDSLQKLEKISQNKEIDLGDFDDEEFEYECPHCGFRFNE